MKDKSAAALLWICITCNGLVTISGQVDNFFLNGVSYPNHGLVLLSEVGEGDSSLHCVSDDHSRCSEEFSSQREFFFPNNSHVPDASETGDEGYYRSRADDRISLNRRGGKITGLFRCHINTLANPSGEDFYVGVYDHSSGYPNITSMVYNSEDSTIMCTSSGGPATTVSWRKNCRSLPNISDYQQSQTVTSTITATYCSTLGINSGVVDEDDVYTCIVTNIRGSSSLSIGVGGITVAVEYSFRQALPLTVSIVEENSPVIGQPYNLTCLVHDTGVEIDASLVSFQWIGLDGELLGVNSTLTLDPLRGDSRGEYACQVTVGNGSDESVGCGVKYIAPSISVSVSGGEAMAGESFTLICSVKGDPLSASVIFSWLKGESELSSCTTSMCTISSVQITDAGDDYICKVSVSGFEVANATGTLRVTLPTPDISFRRKSFPPFYVGLDYAWRCDARIVGPALSGVTADITWSINDSEEISESSRIHQGHVVVSTAGAEWRRAVFIAPLSSIDSGTYKCSATFRPATPNEFVTNGYGTRMDHLSVITPTLSVRLSSSITRVLDVSSYNTFFLTCTARSLVDDVPTALSKTFQWIRVIDSSQPKIINSLNGVVIRDSKLDEATSHSRVRVTTTLAGLHTYSCQVSLNGTPETDNITEQRKSNVTVQGPILPNVPTELTAINTSHNSAIIEWTIVSIAYEPETYTVQYGTAISSITFTSDPVFSGPNITRTNFVMSVELVGLPSFTQYYYQVVATNAAGSTASEDPETFVTLPGLEPIIIATANGSTPVAGQNYSISCSVTGAGRLNSSTTYQWFKDNTEIVGETQSTLSFHSLSVSNAGQYRCEATIHSTLLRQPITNTSNLHNLIVQIQSPSSVTVTASPDGTTFTGSSLSLTCIVELNKEVADTAVTVNTEWSGPTGTQFMSNTTVGTKTKDGTYISTATLSVGTSDPGNYTCTAYVSSTSRFLTASNEVAAVGIKKGGLMQMFQLNLVRTDDCISWNREKAAEIKSNLHKELIEAIEIRCQCKLPEDNILSGVFSCRKSQKQTSYRSTILGTQHHTARELVTFIQDWVNSAPVVTIQWYTVELDPKCSASISSLRDPECEDSGS